MVVYGNKTTKQNSLDGEDHMKRTQYSIEATDLTRKFGDLVAVDHINFKVKKGELWGLLGPNGAGKTTTVKMLCGLLPPTDGTATVGGQDVRNEVGEIRKLIGFCPQEATVYERLTGRENVNLIGQMHKMPKTELKKKTDELLEKIGLAERADDQVITYSGGMKRRLDLIMALVHDPPILFLDEPTLGLDPAVRRAVWDFIVELKERKKTVVMTTHYMEEADELCDRVAIIDYGKIIEEGSPEKLKEKVGRGDRIEMEFSGRAEVAIEQLKQLKFVKTVAAVENRLVVVAEAGVLRLGEIIKTASQAGTIGRTSLSENTLEDVFLHLTGRRLR
jgi:ABC-2 type transport system ATP-binding protein